MKSKRKAGSTARRERREVAVLRQEQAFARKVAVNFDEVLMARVRSIHAESGESDGAPRVHHELQAEGLPASPKRVARLMREEGLVARPSKAPRIRTTDSNHDNPIAPHLLARQFDVQGVALDRVWVADITYIPTRAGVLYLAIVLDLGSRRCVGWAMREARQPAPGLIHHSDRGSQRGRVPRRTRRARDGGEHERQGRLLR